MSKLLVDCARRSVLQAVTAIAGGIVLPSLSTRADLPIPGQGGAAMDITLFLFDDVTALDAVGPYDALRRLPDVKIRFAGLERGSIDTSGGALKLQADVSIREVHQTDLLIVPGGGADGLRQTMKDEAFLTWVWQIHQTSRWTTAVCTGSLLLGAAGLLQGLNVSTNWRARSALANFGATYSGQRITESGKIITSAGVSAGIDMGLRLCALIAGAETARAVQLSMEYKPEPPFSVGTADEEPELVEIVNTVLRS